MNEYHTALSLPKNVFREGISPQTFPIKRRTLLVPELHLNPDIINIIHSVDLVIRQVELFYSPPNLVSGIHRDVPNADISKINWVYFGKDSIMSWYDTDPNKPLTGPIGNKYKSYSREESILLHSYKIHSPSLVQAGIAHNITNFNEERWAVSLMLIYKNPDKNFIEQCPYNESIARLKEYIL
jgi:hypothetical protein